MTTGIDEKFIAYAVDKLANELVRFSDDSLSVEESKSLAREIVASVDWKNPALMHKGFTWMARSYLAKLQRTSV